MSAYPSNQSQQSENSLHFVKLATDVACRDLYTLVREFSLFHITGETISRKGTNPRSQYLNPRALKLSGAICRSAKSSCVPRSPDIDFS
jgi:hypothetical protein